MCFILYRICGGIASICAKVPFSPGGVLLGIVFGSIPGLSATMAIALCLPMTYGMLPINDMALLIGLYIGGISGGLVAAILLRIPGTPSSVATCFDGKPMANKGEAGKALGSGVVFSFVGTIIGIGLLVVLSPVLCGFALKFQAYEYCALAIFSLSMVIALTGHDMPKGLVSAVLGSLLAPWVCPLSTPSPASPLVSIN